MNYENGKRNRGTRTVVVSRARDSCGWNNDVIVNRVRGSWGGDNVSPACSFLGRLQGFRNRDGPCLLKDKRMKDKLGNRRARGPSVRPCGLLGNTAPPKRMKAEG